MGLYLGENKMSKRFGRNQKRAMRNQIQLQEKLLEQHIEHTSSLNSELRQANEVINRTADILGEHFASLPVKTKEVREIQNRYQYAIHKPVMFGNYYRQDPTMAFVDNTLGYIETHELCSSIDELRHMIHMRYISESGRVVYGLSEKAWRKLSEKQLVLLIKEQIAVEMATLLVEHRKKSMI